MNRESSQGAHNVNVFDDIQSLCSDFRRQLKKGERRRIEDYLGRLDETAQQNLFQNLLHIDLEFRRRQQEDPSSDEYVARFPQFGRLIRQAFFESTMMSREMIKDTPADEQTLVLGIPPAARKLGDYELQRELGRGGFGVVYKARHLHRNDVVALKTLPTGIDGQSHSPGNAERLHKFRHEFRSLSEVNHPNLVGMQTLEVDGNQWFFTMDLVNGVDFLDYVRPNGQLDEQRLRRALTQLVQGIRALHEQGIVHRDLKPNNVLVNADGRVVILDFGLVAELQQRNDQTMSMQSQQFAGTPRYAAPEQAVGTRTTATDWYALGVMLYEALINEAPFQGAAVQVIVKKQNEDAPRLGGNAELPPDLAALVDQLLQREPERRPDAGAICQTLGITVESSRHDSTDSSLMTASSQSETLLIGRESQLKQLESACQELLKNREPVVVFISGRSGEGKTSLAEKFLTPLRLDREMLVLSGRCYDRESVPFKAIDSLIDALVAFLRSRPTDEVLRLLPDDIHMLAHLFPVLRRVGAIADRAIVNIRGIDDRQIRYRAFFALRELLISISRSTPVAVFIDDLQWGDADSAEVLFDLMSPPDPPAILFLGSYRGDEADDSPFLREWNSLRRRHGTNFHNRDIRVEALNEDQCLRLLELRTGTLLGNLRQQASQLIRETGGNAYLLEQLIQSIDPATGQIQSNSFHEIIENRFLRLPADSSHLLEVIAIAGQAVPLNEVSGVAGFQSSMFSTVTHMRSEQLVRLIGAEDQQLVDTYHDKIRETMLDRMDDSRRRELHLRYAELLEEYEHLNEADILHFLELDASFPHEPPEFSDRIFDVAYHFHAAGDPRGFAYQLMAGELSFRAYASEDALEYLTRAEAILPPQSSDHLRYRNYERLAASLSRLKQFDAALSAYKLAIEFAPSGLAGATAYSGVALIHQTRSEYALARESYDAAFAQIDGKQPHSLKAVWSIMQMAARIFLVPRQWGRAADENENAKRALEQKMCTNMGYFLFEQPNAILSTLYNAYRVGFLAVKSCDDARFAVGMTTFAASLAMLGWPGMGKRQLRRAEQIADEVGNAEVQGKRFMASAMVHATSRQLQQAGREFRESIPLLSKAGSHWQTLMANHLNRHVKAVIGTSSEETECAYEVLEFGREVGDLRGQCYGRYDIASGLARAGSIESALSRIEQAREILAPREMLVTQSIFLATEGFVRLQSSDYHGAFVVCEKSWNICQQSKMLVEYNVRCLPQLVEALVGPNWAGTCGSTKRKELKRWCRLARLTYWFFPTLQPPILRARGRAYAALGKRNKAIRCFERGVKCALDLGADYDRAKSLLDLAAVKKEGRDELRREAVELLQTQESVIPYAERWLLGDFYDERCVAPPLSSDLIESAANGAGK